MGKPRNTQKYPTYLEIPESKKDTRKYLIVYFDTPTRPEPDPLPGILSNTRPDLILKNPTRWALVRNLSSLVPAAAPSGIREHTRSAGSRAAPSGNLSPARGGIPFSPPPLDPSAQPVEQKSLFFLFLFFLTFGTFSTTVLLT